MTRCSSCRRAEASRLCDRVIGWSARVDNTGPAPRMVRGRMFTCDAPLCDACATVAGHKHFCGPGGCEVASVDLCPAHRDAADSREFITTEVARVLRAKARIVAVPDCAVEP